MPPITSREVSVGNVNGVAVSVHVVAFARKVGVIKDEFSVTLCRCRLVSVKHIGVFAFPMSPVYAKT